MENEGLYELFIEELEDMFSSERQIVQTLPQLVQAASLPELKEALSNHLKETKNQVTRIEKIYAILGVQPVENLCEGMKGILQEVEELTEGKSKSPTLDAAIISAAQKVEHYEIASYTTLKSFAKHLELDSEVVDLIEDTLKEELAADKKLTKIADGSFFSSGVNKEAAFAGSAPKGYKK
jgi:ferritin-like metal-binding protein YciE